MDRLTGDLAFMCAVALGLTCAAAAAAQDWLRAWRERRDQSPFLFATVLAGLIGALWITSLAVLTARIIAYWYAAFYIEAAAWLRESVAAALATGGIWYGIWWWRRR